MEKTQCPNCSHSLKKAKRHLKIHCLGIAFVLECPECHEKYELLYKSDFYPWAISIILMVLVIEFFGRNGTPKVRLLQLLIIFLPDLLRGAYTFLFPMKMVEKNHALLAKYDKNRL